MVKSRVVMVEAKEAGKDVASKVALVLSPVQVKSTGKRSPPSFLTQVCSAESNTKSPGISALQGMVTLLEDSVVMALLPAMKMVGTWVSPLYTGVFTEVVCPKKLVA